MTDIHSNEKVIRYFGMAVKVNCDRKCHKAWGIVCRPSIQLSADIDDIAYLADSELGDAPIDPGTYEGTDAKPLSPDQFPNRWCVRQCERCNKSRPGEWGMPLKVNSFDERVYNIPREEGTEG